MQMRRYRLTTTRMYLLKLGLRGPGVTALFNSCFPSCCLHMLQSLYER